MIQLIIIPFIRGAAFGAGALAALFLLSWMFGPAKAEEYIPPPRVTVHHDPSPGAAWFARIVVENRIGVYNRATAHDTAHGPVTVEYWTTLPSAVGDPGSADRACVVSLPPGVVAVPECVEILETERGEILLLKYLGG
jgi:hypothetical protein